MRSSRYALMVFAALAAIGLVLESSADGAGRRGACTATTTVPVVFAADSAGKAAKDDGPADRKADRESVRKAIEAFSAAFQKGDAKVVAGMWTADGEYIDDGGTTIRGRTALEKDYGDYFKKNPTNSLAVEIEGIRFPSRDTAVVDGFFKLRMGKSAELIVSRCSFLYTREDGKWLIAIAREWPGDGLALRDLEWLIGDWETKRDGTVVSSKYEWTANKSFIRCTFSILQDGTSHGGMQMIGKDPSTGALRVWTFEDAGGIGDTEMTREGKKWMHAARGVTADGKVLSATSIMTPIDSDSFLWQSVNRTLNDDALPDQPPVKVVRVKAKK